MADASVSKTDIERCVGSNPTPGTTSRMTRRVRVLLYAAAWRVASACTAAWRVASVCTAAICTAAEALPTSGRFDEEDIVELERLPYSLTVCKVASVADIDFDSNFFFVGKTDEEISLVCTTDRTPAQTIEREDGWKAFRIVGTLDFSLVGILSKISGILADEDIGIFAVSTYNTDYILVKEANFDRALRALAGKGYAIVS